MGAEVYAIDCALHPTNPKELFTCDEMRDLYTKFQPGFMDNFNERHDVMQHVKFIRYMYPTFPCDLHVKDFNKIIKEYDINVCIFLIDIWILATDRPNAKGQLEAVPDDQLERFACPAACWLPIHFDPVEERTVKAARLFDYIVTLASDGERKLKALFPDKPMSRVPHNIDFQHYNTDALDVGAFRRSIDVPEDAFMVTCVMNNSENTGRKSFCSNLESFSRFHARHPESILYLHAKLGGSIDLNLLIDYFGIRDAVRYSDQTKMMSSGYTIDFVVNLYKATDMLLSASCSEGFCVPVIEAQAVGTPVVVSNNTAPPDNVYNGEIADNFDSKKMVYMNTSFWNLPDMQDVVECMDRIYHRTAEEKVEKRAIGIKAIREGYNSEVLFDGWQNVLRTMFPKRTFDKITVVPTSMITDGKVVRL
jgi:glycosyltransferase involved in cell wall biosynthesis